MSLAGSARAGLAQCVCPPGVGGLAAAPGSRRQVALLSLGAAASVLSQVLSYGFLPLAGLMLAPEPGLVTVPFAAHLIGAVAATFPAAILTDAFGRRAAFALGASLGIAGGLVVAWSLLHGVFASLVLGAFWLGLANGFALRYRHAAALGVAAADRARATAIVIGASAAVGLIAPSLAGLFEPAFTPVLGVGTAILVACAHVVALAAALVLPSETPVADDEETRAGRAHLARCRRLSPPAPGSA